MSVSRKLYPSEPLCWLSQSHYRSVFLDDFKGTAEFTNRRFWILSVPSPWAESISAFTSCLKAQSSVFISSGVSLFYYWTWKYSEQQKVWDLLDTVKTLFLVYHYLCIFVNFMFVRVMTIFYFFYNQNPHLSLLWLSRGCLFCNSADQPSWNMLFPLNNQSFPIDHLSLKQ